MAKVRLTGSFAAAAGVDHLVVDAATVGQLCEELGARYPGPFRRLLQPDGRLSPGAVVLVNRRNAHTLSAAQTALEPDSEVLIMPLMSGG